MEIFLSKFVPLFIYPVGLLFCILIVISILIFTRRLRAAQTFLIAGILLVFVAGNGWTAYKLIRSLEDRYRPMSVEDTPQGDVIVVLGGGIALPLPPRLYTELNGSSDRLLHALRLYRAGKADYILLTGGNVFDQPGLESASHYARELLELWGVPSTAIVMERESRNTIQNAEYTAPVLRERQWTKVLLVTSATHMHRSMLAFRSAGIEAIPVPIDFQAVDSAEPEALSWIPSANALGATTHALHEYLGRLWYRIRL